jgi:hypothetical protein
VHDAVALLSDIQGSSSLHPFLVPSRRFTMRISLPGEKAKRIQSWWYENGVFNMKKV